MKKHTIVVCDHIHEAGLEMLRNDKSINFIMAADEDKVKLLTIIESADIAITRSSTDVDAAFIASFAEKPNFFDISENSLTKAIFICLKVFSNSFDASATSAFGAL